MATRARSSWADSRVENMHIGALVGGRNTIPSTDTYQKRSLLMSYYC